MAPPSPDLVLPLLLLHLVTSSGVKPYPFALLPWHRSPSSIAAAQWLSPAVESQDPGVRPLPDGAAKQVNHRSTQLPHRLNRSDGVSEPDGPVSGDGSAGGGGGAARDEVGEVGGVVVVRSASGPGGRPRGPMKVHAVR
jgi:hypothetical protein